MRRFCAFSSFVLLLARGFFNALEIWPAGCWNSEVFEVAAEPPNHSCQSSTFASLEEKGYAVFPNFTSPELLARIQASLDRVPWEFDTIVDPDDETATTDRKDFLRKILDWDVYDEFPRKGLLGELDVLLANFWKDARERLNFPLVETPQVGIVYSYLNESLRGSSWHVDTQQACRDAETSSELNLILMVRKTHRDSAGFSFVGLDTLRNRIPQLAPILADSGGTEIDRGNIIRQPSTDCTYSFNSTLEELGCSPEAGPGDIFVYRNDLFHRTQANHRGTREALYVRLSSQCSLSSSLKGGRQKYWHMLFNEEKGEFYIFNNHKLLREFVFPHGIFPRRFPWIAQRIISILWLSLRLVGYAWREILFPIRVLMEAVMYGAEGMKATLFESRRAAFHFCGCYTTRKCQCTSDTFERVLSRISGVAHDSHNAHTCPSNTLPRSHHTCLGALAAFFFLLVCRKHAQVKGRRA